ncbi:MAG TPA: hypothetical protein VNR64_09140 [Vicinamibacterales bacterium]|nr:hypothetical protein [Vicinamibacterales bacterium]
MTRAAVASAVVLALLSCGSRGQPSATGPQAGGATPASSSSAPPPVHVAHQPPTPKDVIDAAIASGSVPLSVSPTCANVGTETSDATIGRYLAGFLAEMSSDKKNWIETTIEPGTSGTGEAVSICTLTLRHEAGDDRWGWGVRFYVRTSDGLVLPSSFTCVGAG